MSWRSQIGAIGLLLGMIFWSFSQPVYSTGATPETRATRWEIFLYLLWPDGDEHPWAQFAEAWTQSSAGAWLAERVPVLLGAGLLHLVGLAAGRVTLAWCFPNHRATRAESLVLAWGIGSALLSILTQGLGLAGVLARPVFMGIGLVLLGGTIIRGQLLPALRPYPRNPWGWWALGSAPLLLLSLASALLPTPDYDAHAYHLLGPKEWFEQGRILFLPHNVYTSFPFLTEMFSLLGMVLAGDVFLGGLIGQTFLWGFGPMTTLAIFLVARRLYGTSAGLWASFIYASCPWVYRLSSIPYVEGAMLFYLSAGLLALRIDAPASAGGAWLVGALAGCAFGCKYPALAMVALPFAVGLVIESRAHLPRRLVLFGIGFLVVSAVWLIRNALWTGNPIFPLIDPLFAGDHWSPERYERFRVAHQSTDFRWTTWLAFAQDILVRSDWQSPLIAAGLPLLLWVSRSRTTWLLLLLGLYQFVLFFLGTHRLDRFFLTMEPVLAILSGAGLAAGAQAGLARGATMFIAGLVLVYNILFCLTPLAGMNLFAARWSEARAVSIDAVSPTLTQLRDSNLVPASRRVLFVGLAAVYESPTRSLYNTVFDQSLLAQLTLIEPDSNDPMPLPTEEIRQRLVGRGVDFILVDWTWVRRYREPGNYGFPSFVEPAFFDTLVRRGLLRPVKVDGVWDLFEVIQEAH